MRKMVLIEPVKKLLSQFDPDINLFIKVHSDNQSLFKSRKILKNKINQIEKKYNKKADWSWVSVSHTKNALGLCYLNINNAKDNGQGNSQGNSQNNGQANAQEMISNVTPNNNQSNIQSNIQSTFPSNNQYEKKAIGFDIEQKTRISKNIVYRVLSSSEKKYLESLFNLSSAQSFAQSFAQRTSTLSGQGSSALSGPSSLGLLAQSFAQSFAQRTSTLSGQGSSALSGPSSLGLLAQSSEQLLDQSQDLILGLWSAKEAIFKSRGGLKVIENLYSPPQTLSEIEITKIKINKIKVNQTGRAEGADQIKTNSSLSERLALKNPKINLYTCYSQAEQGPYKIFSKAFLMVGSKLTLCVAYSTLVKK